MIKMAITFFVSGVILGLGPCMASCGPLLVSYITAYGKGYKSALRVWFEFSFAKVAAYCVVGLIAGVFGTFFLKSIYSSEITKHIKIAAGLIIIASGLFIIFGKRREHKMCPALFGFIIGILPCGPLLGLFTAIGFTSSRITDGIVFGLSFGLGTVLSPLLILAVLAGSVEKFLKNERANRFFRIISGLVIVIWGVVIGYRGFYR